MNHHKPSSVARDKQSSDAVAHLLDHQVVDRDGKLVCKVDDLELTEGLAGELSVSAILVGPGALGPRLGGRLGEWVVAGWRRLRMDRHAEPGRIDWSAVTDVTSSVKVARTRAELNVEGFETWVDERIIKRIPGSRHESGR